MGRRFGGRDDGSGGTVQSGSGGAIVTSELRVSGSASVYRVFDVGYAIALEHAARLLGESPAAKVRLERMEARAFEIRNPPLVVPLGSCNVRLGDDSRSGEVSARLFDFGVASLQLRIAAAP